MTDKPERLNKPLRLDVDLVARIEKWRATWLAKNGVPMSFNAAASVLLERGLRVAR